VYTCTHLHSQKHTHTHTHLQVTWHVRSKLQVPPAAPPPYEPKWQLEAAASELTDIVLDHEEEPPKPDVS